MLQKIFFCVLYNIYLLMEISPERGLHWLQKVYVVFTLYLCPSICNPLLAASFCQLRLTGSGMTRAHNKITTAVNHEARSYLWLRSPANSGSATIIIAAYTTYTHLCTYALAVQVIWFTLCIGKHRRQKNEESGRKRKLKKK